MALDECYSRRWQKQLVNIGQLTRWSLISARRCRGGVGRGGYRFCWGWRTRPRVIWPFYLVYRYAAFVDQLKSKQKSVTESFIMHVYRDKKLEFERNIFSKFNLWWFNLLTALIHISASRNVHRGFIVLAIHIGSVTLSSGRARSARAATRHHHVYVWGSNCFAVFSWSKVNYDN